MPPLAADRSASWRRALALEPLPIESGWWAPLSRSTLRVREGGAELDAHSSIYYLLDEERPVNYWHRLAPDDVHVLLDGGPVEYVIVSSTGEVTRRVLGHRVDAGQELVIPCAAGSTKALRLLDPKGFALIASVLTPAWTPDRVWFEPPAVPDDAAPEWFDAALVAALTSPET
ncbi:cupin domain-containing protein [Microbacterium sp. SORGH_AS_0888]|uniref:cupin domain-containing protein n=1 Tax=Microbacterium sp. SORGH_AS_0888 TaxID=3041791 RepID=UPI00278AB799|nr:cupin domain-containing protein [Microbacterium sp. SORGH_AS_0888]MDQ1128108.1 putative cupin superfamily sugar epimerase [Microbacterium sp. SORGH_AS_0888]